MKKFINKVENVENEMIEGLIKAHSDKICKLDCGNVIVRKNKKEDKVAIITGGGSGHEPSFGGYVGTGMLDAMIPSLGDMEIAFADGLSDKEVLLCGVKAAQDGIEFTKTIAATKGRASYIGERSIGHQDPGATSFTCLLEEVADSL